MSGTTSGWLRSLRLHKYTDNLSHLDLKALSQLNDSDLSALGVSAQGARRKLLLAIKCNVSMCGRMTSVSRDMLQNGQIVDAVDALRDVLMTYKDQLATCGVLAEFSEQYLGMIFKALCYVTVGEPDPESLFSLLRLIQESILSGCFARRDMARFYEWKDDLERVAVKSGWDLNGLDFDEAELANQGQGVVRHRRQRRSRTRRAQSDSAKVDPSVLIGGGHVSHMNQGHMNQGQLHNQGHIQHHNQGQVHIQHHNQVGQQWTYPMSGMMQNQSNQQNQSNNQPMSATSNASTAPLSANSAPANGKSPRYNDVFHGGIISPIFDQMQQGHVTQGQGQHMTQVLQQGQGQHVQQQGHFYGHHHVTQNHVTQSHVHQSSSFPKGSLISPRYADTAPFSLAPGAHRPQHTHVDNHMDNIHVDNDDVIVPTLLPIGSFADGEPAAGGREGVWRRRWEQQQMQMQNQGVSQGVNQGVNQGVSQGSESVVE